MKANDGPIIQTDFTILTPLGWVRAELIRIISGVKSIHFKIGLFLTFEPLLLGLSV